MCPCSGLHSDPDHPGEDEPFSILPWWWPCQGAPGHTAALAGQAGQWGQKDTRGRELLVSLTFAGVVMDYLCLPDLSFPLRDPCSSSQRVCLPAPCCQLRGARRALRLCQRQPWPWPRQRLRSPARGPLLQGQGWCPHSHAGTSCPFDR